MEGEEVVEMIGDWREEEEDEEEQIHSDYCQMEKLSLFLYFLCTD